MVEERAQLVPSKSDLNANKFIDGARSRKRDPFFNFSTGGKLALFSYTNFSGLVKRTQSSGTRSTKHIQTTVLAACTAEQ
jgi:hypothetical protein